MTFPATHLDGKLNVLSRYNERNQTYSAAGYLIAQLGKNYTDGANEIISGEELLNLALNVIRKIQYRVGGMISFVETTRSEKLINFYTRNGFHLISNPNTPREELIQFFRML